MENEYMIGDLVRYKQVVQFAPIVVKERCGKITEASPISIKVTDMDRFFLSEIMDKDSISGMPLNSEILKANGWIDVAEDVYLSSQGNLYVRRTDSQWCACIGGSVILSFNFVHQLQHLMFGLGLGMPSETFRTLSNEIEGERDLSSESSEICELMEKGWCLVRDANCSSGDVWRLAQFAFALRGDNDRLLYYTVGGLFWEECIPYNDKTKHLLGTRDNWEE